MKSLFKKKLPPIVGLDIGTRQIKALCAAGVRMRAYLETGVFRT